MNGRRARTLLGLSVVLVAAAVYSQPTWAKACGTQSDFLVSNDPLLARVQPTDCSRVFHGPPEFTWPAAAGRRNYTVTLQLPDGSTQARETDRNWLVWDAPLPAGRYSWRVSVKGSETATSADRVFTVERTAAFIPAARTGT